MGVTVLKDHTSWQMFMALPANSLLQSGQHGTAFVHIHFWISKNECNSDASCSIEYRCHSLTAYWHTFHFVAVNEDGCVQCSSIWVKLWAHVSQCHHGFQGPICSSFKWLKKCKSTSKHQILWTSITHFATHHALTHCCIPVVHGQFWVRFSQIIPVQWINLKLCLVSFPKPVPPLVLCSPWWMPTHFWTLCTLSTSDAVSVHHHKTPALTGSEYQDWKLFVYINHIITQSFLHDRVCTVITTAHKIIP